jgi:hypothetical protein
MSLKERLFVSAFWHVVEFFFEIATVAEKKNLHKTLQERMIVKTPLSSSWGCQTFICTYQRAYPQGDGGGCWGP